MGAFSFTDHGAFSMYDRADGQIVAGLKVPYARNEAGIDWYDLCRDAEDGLLWVELNAAGVVVRVCRDPSMAFPSGRRVLAVRGDLGEVLGMLFDGGSFVAAPTPVPPEITRRQCAIELHARSLITDQEAVAMVAAGTPPAIIASFIAQMPADQRLLAQINFATDRYERANALVGSLLAAQGATDAEVDNFFRSAAAR